MIDMISPELIEQIQELVETHTVHIYYTCYGNISMMPWIKFLKFYPTKLFSYNTLVKNLVPEPNSDIVFKMSHPSYNIYYLPKEYPITPIPINNVQITLPDTHCWDLYSRNRGIFEFESIYLKQAKKFTITVDCKSVAEHVISCGWWDKDMIPVSSCSIQGPSSENQNMVDMLRCLSLESLYLKDNPYEMFMMKIKKYIMTSVYLDILEANSSMEQLRKQISAGDLSLTEEASTLQNKLWELAQTQFELHPDFIQLKKFNNLYLKRIIMTFILDWNYIGMIVSKWLYCADELESRLQKYKNNSWNTKYNHELGLFEKHTMYDELAICDLIHLHKILEYRYSKNTYVPKWLTLTELKLPDSIHHIIERNINIYRTYVWMMNYDRWIHYIINVYKVLQKHAMNLKFTRTDNCGQVDPVLLPCKNGIPHIVTTPDFQYDLLIPIYGKPNGLPNAPSFVTSITDEERYTIAKMCTCKPLKTVNCCDGPGGSSQLDLLKLAGIVPVKPLPTEAVPHNNQTYVYRALHRSRSRSIKTIYPSVSEMVATIDSNILLQNTPVKPNVLSLCDIHSQLNHFIEDYTYTPSLDQFIVYLWNWQVTQSCTYILPSNIIELATQALAEL